MDNWYSVSQMAAELSKRNIDIFSEKDNKIIIDEDKIIYAALDTFGFEQYSNEGPFECWTFYGSFQNLE